MSGAGSMSMSTYSGGDGDSDVHSASPVERPVLSMERVGERSKSRKLPPSVGISMDMDGGLDAAANVDCMASNVFLASSECSR